MIVISKIGYFIFGKITSNFMYESKYLNSQYFENIDSPGWKWACMDAKSRIFMGHNRKIPWPMGEGSRVAEWKNINCHKESLIVFQSPGTYFQGIGGKIIIGKGVLIAPNVGIINSNHNLENPKKREKGKDVKIGNYCWIGMNSVILPGVVLGEHTVVGAGSVVTKSFSDGKCVIAGNPARIIKSL